MKDSADGVEPSLPRGTTTMTREQMRIMVKYVLDTQGPCDPDQVGDVSLLNRNLPICDCYRAWLIADAV